MHDAAALAPSGWIADKGYIGKGMITPHKKPPNGELSEAAQEANRSISRIRQAERADHRPHQGLENPPHPYRRPLETFEQTITAALLLYVFKTTL